MTAFADLPLDLIPRLLEPLKYIYVDLARVCLVNSVFRNAALPLLYEYIRIRNLDLVEPVGDLVDVPSRLKLDQIIRTLCNSPNLARLVIKLEMRVWRSHDTIEHDVQQAIRNCTQIRHLIWTRQGSLTPELMRTMCMCPNLERLDVNGGDSSVASAVGMQSQSIKGLTFIMPNERLIKNLPSILGQYPNLQELKLLSWSRTGMDDGLLEKILALSLRLTTFGIGASRISEGALVRFITQQSDIRILHLEGLHLEDRFLKGVSKSLPHLSEIRLTYSPIHLSIVPFLEGLEAFVSTSPNLKSISLVSSVRHDRNLRLGSNWLCNVSTGLKYLELRGFDLLPSDLERICSFSPNLEDLSIQMEWQKFQVAAHALTPLRQLETLHVHTNYDLDRLEREDWLPRNQLVCILQPLSNRLYRFSVRTTLWSVERSAEGVQVGPYQLPFWPSFGPF